MTKADDVSEAFVMFFIAVRKFRLVTSWIWTSAFQMHDPDFNLSDRDFGNPVRFRLESMTKEDYIRGHPAGTLVIDAKLIGPGPTQLILEEIVECGQEPDLNPEPHKPIRIQRKSSGPRIELGQKDS